MRKIVVAAFVTLDGVIQAPGGPEEDTSGDFKYGGWVAGHWDDLVGTAINDMFSHPFDLLLGRKTYDIFAAYWPYVETNPKASGFDEGDLQIAKAFNKVTKYVATHRPESLTWQNSKDLGKDVVATLKDLKKQDGPTLLTQGSSELIQILLKNNLVDELRLCVFPITLGKGKRLFGEGTQAAAFKITKSTITPSGVMIASYESAGNVKTGSLGSKEPTKAELERRKNLKSAA